MSSGRNVRLASGKRYRHSRREYAIWDAKQEKSSPEHDSKTETDAKNKRPEFSPAYEFMNEKTKERVKEGWGTRFFVKHKTPLVRQECILCFLKNQGKEYKSNSISFSLPLNEGVGDTSHFWRLRESREIRERQQPDVGSQRENKWQYHDCKWW